jgi:hypothetical protein
LSGETLLGTKMLRNLMNEECYALQAICVATKLQDRNIAASAFLFVYLFMKAIYHKNVELSR